MKAQDGSLSDCPCPGVDRCRLIEPYGGRLEESFAGVSERPELMQRLSSLPRVQLTRSEFRDLMMLGSGAYSPLTGFMDRQTYREVCEAQLLPSGLPWGLPVTLAVTKRVVARLELGQEAALYFNDEPVALLRLQEIFPWDPLAEAKAVYAADDIDHPVLAERSKARKHYLLAGPVRLVVATDSRLLAKEHLWPKNARCLFIERGWARVVAVHADHLWHRAHEYLLKSALETADALLFHTPTEPPQHEGALPNKVIADARDILLRQFFPRDRVLWTRFAADVTAYGGRRAILHQAIVSQNYGCGHLILLPDNPISESHGVVQDSYAAVRWPDAGPAIRPVVLSSAFYCDACGGVATGKSCPHGEEQRSLMSEETVLDKLLTGEQLPSQVARPEIARALSRSVSSLFADKVVKRGRHIFPHAAEVSKEFRQTAAGHKAAVLWMTGLSGSGKSTVARRVEKELLVSGHRIFVLDGDGLRNGLCRDLDFSRDARRENLRRAAEVAKIMLESGTLVIASFISPFREERQMVREIIGEGFFEVYIDASLQVCESRDPKGLYSRARAGIIPEFTGVSSPYEPPPAPDMRVNTAARSIDDCARQLLGDMARAGLLRKTRFDRYFAEKKGSSPHVVQRN